MKKMGRTPKFNFNVALKAAMNTFWEKGWNASTVDDLTDAMDIQKGSFYRSFGSKKDVMVASLKHYNETLVRQRQDLINSSDDPVNAIFEFYRALVIRNSADGARGCLNTNTTIEVGSKDAEITAILEQSADAWESTFYKAIKKAQKSGELSADINAKDLSKLFVVLTQGINVVSKVKTEKSYFNGVLRAAFSFLPKQK